MDKLRFKSMMSSPLKGLRSSQRSSTNISSAAAESAVNYPNHSEEDLSLSFRPKTNEPQIPDEEIEKEIPEEFYQEECDPFAIILEGLDTTTIESLEGAVSRTQRQRDIIDGKLSADIMDNYKSFVQGMNRVQEFSADLQTTIFLLQESQKHLGSARSGLTSGGLEILAKAKKNNILKDMNTEVLGVKSILADGVQLTKALDAGDYPTAIEICMRCQQEGLRYKHLLSIQDINTRNLALYDTIEEKMEASLLQCCRDFNADAYKKVLIGYKLVGKPQHVQDLVQIHLNTLVDTLSHDVVYKYVLLTNATASTNPERLKSKPFKELCSMLKEDGDYIPALRALLETQCGMMLNLQRILTWHKSAPTSSYFTEVESKLHRCRRSLWDDIQRKCAACLSVKSFTAFKFEDFLTVLNLINRGINIGDAFVGTPSSILRGSVKQQATEFFSISHRSRMEDLRTMLENEGWFPCPLAPDFGIDSMREFDFSRNVVVGNSLSENAGSGAAALHSFESFIVDGFISFADKDVMPTANSKTSSNGTADSDDDDEDGEELRREFVNEDEEEDTRRKPTSTAPPGANRLPGSRSDDNSMNATVRARRRAAAERNVNAAHGPIVSSTTVNVLRLIGRYISMTEVLSPIADDVLDGMTHIIEYYIYSVFKFFTSDAATRPGDLLAPDPFLPPKLRSTLMRLRERFEERSHDALALQDIVADNVLQRKFLAPKLSSVVDLKTANRLQGLTHRITGIESLLFMEQALHRVREKLESLVPASRKPFLLQFYSQTIEPLSDLRQFMYRCIGRKLISYDAILQQMGTVSWDSAAAVMDHSPYVETILKEFDLFKTRLENDPGLKDTPKDVSEVVWKYVIVNGIESLVEGFSRPRKISSSGSARMQLDLQVFLGGIKPKTTLRPIPYTSFADNFIKAYYLTNEVEAEKWIMEHKEYNNKQLLSIVNTGVGTRVDKKLRQHLINVVEELDRRRG